MKSYVEKSIAAYVDGIRRAIREGREHHARCYTINLVRALPVRDVDEDKSAGEYAERGERQMSPRPAQDK